MAKERPILFSTPMVQAILSNKKLQTRRVVKPQPEAMPSNYPIPVADFVKDLETLNAKGLRNFSSSGATKGLVIPDCPYGEIGDLLWVREKFLYDEGEGIYWYAASMDNADVNYLKGCWKPSIFLPKIASRIWLEITDIKIERLKDISEKDARNEGVETVADGYKNYMTKPKIISTLKCYDTAYYSFLSLWESINGYESSELNPWVWVITFKKVAKP
jgi:hypothetical protein